MSNRTIATPGADQVVTGGMALRACSSVSNNTNPKPSRSTGSIQYPATKPNAVRTRGSSSLVNAAAAAGARAGYNGQVHQCGMHRYPIARVFTRWQATLRLDELLLAT